jgi:hypothetical protein
MAALTDATRKKVHELLVNDTTIPQANRFVHVSQNWHGTANNEEYVSPARYHEVMMDSMFAICPKGHSVEQFRIYEAIETGAIPVMDLRDGCVNMRPSPPTHPPCILCARTAKSVVICALQHALHTFSCCHSNANIASLDCKCH